MIRIPTKHIRSVAWINIILGSIFTMSGVIITTLGDFTKLPTPSVIDHITTILIMILLIVSGYTLLKSKKKLKHKELISWSSIIFAFINLLGGIINLFFVTEITGPMLIVGIIMSLLTFALLAISGFFLKKIS